MRYLAALLIMLAANSAVSAKCAPTVTAAKALAAQNTGARVSLPPLVDQPVLKAFFEAEQLDGWDADGFLAVRFDDKTIFVPIRDGLVCDDHPVIALAGERLEELTQLIVRWRARQGLPAPSGSVPERKA